jgi:hypothetical protein
VVWRWGCYRKRLEEEVLAKSWVQEGSQGLEG